MFQTRSDDIQGRLCLFDEEGLAVEDARGALRVEEEALAFEPSQSGALRIGFEEIDFVVPGDHVLKLSLEAGARAELSMLGRRFDEVTRALMERLRDFQTHHLMLDESEGGERFEGAFEASGRAGGPAEARVYRTRLSLFPLESVPFCVPFGEVRACRFDADRHAIDFELLGDRRLSLSRFGRQTQALLGLIEQRLSGLQARTAARLEALVPELSLLARRKLARCLPDGLPASKATLDELAPGLWANLVARAVPQESRAAFEALCARAVESDIAFALKETTGLQNLGDTGADAEEVSPGAEGVAAAEGHVAWFLFPILGGDSPSREDAVAVEIVSRRGWATYFFRAEPDEGRPSLEEGERLERLRREMAEISRTLVALGFRREPIHLSEAALRQPAHRHYRLPLRLSPGLRLARRLFLGRAIHGASWEKQVEAILARSAGARG